MTTGKRSPRSGQGRTKSRGAGVGRRAFPIVGIGASAGGLDALERLLKHVPPDTGMAFLVVQHLDPKHESRLTAILSRVTAMPVAEAKDRMRIDRNHVYIIPPNTSMFVRDTTLRLEPRQEPLSRHMPVDSLFRSLSAAHRNLAVGVILSGTASDGAAGMRAIKGEGGITFAQDAGSAKYFGMPHASIASGTVDFVLPPEEIANSLARIGRHPYLALPEAEGAEPAPPPGRGETLTQLFQLLKKSFGVDFAAYKPSTIGRRIRRRMALHGLDTVGSYIRHVRDKPDELRTLYHDMFIGVTGFFREPDTIEALKRVVFPHLLKERDADSPIRIWVPGCSSGEEVYSLAISLLEFLRNRSGSVPIQVFGSDVNEEAIKKARGGRYPEDIAPDVGRTRLRRFFVKTDQGFEVNQAVRDVCVFAKHDILRDPPFSRLDLLSCRNVLIYMDAPAQRKLLPLFHYTLKPTGFLMLGTAETVGGFSELFTLVERKHKIYAKRATVNRPRFFDWMSEQPAALPPTERHAEPVARRTDFDLQKDAADLIILNEYAPASVLVNDDMEILHFRGHTGAYLEPSPGVASLNLMKMAREGLLLGLRSAVQAARKKGAPASVEGLRLDVDGKERIVDLSVVPVKAPVSEQRTLLVMFRDVTDSLAHLPAAPRRAKAVAERAYEQRLAQLKQELAATKAYLQSVIENQDAANEELITLNEELQHRNAELGQAHNDILNLLTSMSVSMIILDRELRIRRLTPIAQKEMNLLPSDVGRPLTDIRLNVDLPDLDALVMEAIETGVAKRREVRGRDQRWRLLQVHPYVTADGRTEGAVLSLSDIHDAKVAEETFRAFVESAPDPMVISDTDGRVRYVNAQTERLFGYAREELLGQPVETLVPAPLRDAHEVHRKVFANDPRARPIGIGLQLAAVHKDGRQIPVEISLSPIQTSEGLLVSANIRDVSDRRRVELEAKRFAVLAERSLARDVHDNLAQGLAGITVHLEGALDIIAGDPDEALTHITRARDQARSSLEQARRSLLALRPEILERADLPGSLEQIAAELCRDASIKVQVVVRGKRRRLPVEIEENLLRIGQEAIANAVGHGAPRHVRVEVGYHTNRVRLDIEDDGRGFDARPRGRFAGLGVSIMKGRAASIGGTLDIRGELGKGTRVEASVPVSGEHAEGVGK